MTHELISIGDTVRHMAFDTIIYIIERDEEKETLKGRYRLHDGRFAVEEFHDYELRFLTEEELQLVK